MSEKALQHQISSAIDLVLQVSRYPDGSRKVAQIAEILGFENGQYQTSTLFEMGAACEESGWKACGKN